MSPDLAAICAQAYAIASLCVCIGGLGTVALIAADLLGWLEG